MFYQNINKYLINIKFIFSKIHKNFTNNPIFLIHRVLHHINLIIWLFNLIRFIEKYIYFLIFFYLTINSQINVLFIFIFPLIFTYIFKIIFNIFDYQITTYLLLTFIFLNFFLVFIIIIFVFLKIYYWFVILPRRDNTLMYHLYWQKNLTYLKKLNFLILI